MLNNCSSISIFVIEGVTDKRLEVAENHAILLTFGRDVGIVSINCNRSWREMMFETNADEVVLFGV